MNTQTDLLRNGAGAFAEDATIATATPFFERAIRALTKIAMAPAAMWKGRSGTFEARERRTSEAERLDRIRNPSNYQGR